MVESTRITELQSAAPMLDNFDRMEFVVDMAKEKLTLKLSGAELKMMLSMKVVDRGEWILGANYYCNAYNPATNKYETSAVWHRGCKYHCMSTGTTETPRWNTTDWVMVEGNPNFMVNLSETDGIYDPDTFDVELQIIASLYNQDITTDIKDVDVVWTRYSEDNKGNARPESDNAWAIKNATKGKEIHLTREDCDFNGYIPKRLKFTATVTLRDGMGNDLANDTITFGY